MDIKHLTHIVALADKRNFARAAEHLHLSQPALSRSIQAAEAALNLRLFDRGALEVKPTPAGEFVLERARRLVFESRCLLRDVNLYRDRTLGNTAFGVGPFPAATVLAPLLVQVRRSHPGVQIRASVGNWELLLSRLRAEELEFFLADTRDIPRTPDLEVTQLVQLPAGLFVRAGHPLLEAGPLKPKGLLEAMVLHGIATVRVPAAMQTLLIQLMGQSSADALPIALECDDVRTLKHVALATDSVLIAPVTAVAAEMNEGRLVQLEAPGFPPAYSDLGLVMLKGRTPSPTAQHVIEQVTAMLQAPSGR
jgi:DNA-binding transcriptional LysR family regulator